MLRLFRNYLCLATALQLGAAVQAQQLSVSKTELTKKPVSAGNAKTSPAKSTTSTPTQSSHPAAAPPGKSEVGTKPEVGTKSEAKPSKAVLQSAKAQPNIVTPKTVKVESNPASAKSVKVDNAVSPKSTKGEATAAGAKSTKGEPTAIAPKSNKIEPVSSAPKSAKIEVGAMSASGTGKSTKEDAKSEKSKEKVVQVKHSSTPRPGLVPPPPPDTPTMFAGDGIFPPGFGVSDYSNPAAIAGRRKDIASQLASAKKLLADKEQHTKDLKDKAVQFESLFSEGVISRRELESAQKESASAINELNDAKTQTVALQNAIGRLDDRMKPKSLAASRKNFKGKAKASTRTPEKLASSPSSQKDAKSASNDKNSAKIVAGKSAHVNGDGAKPEKNDSASKAQSDSTPQTKSDSGSPVKSDSGSKNESASKNGSASKTKTDSTGQTKSDSGSSVKSDSSIKTKNSGAAKGSPVIVAPH